MEFYVRGSLLYVKIKYLVHVQCTIGIDPFLIRAASWQNQQSDCAPSEDSDQPGHPPSLIRVFVVRTKKAWVFSYPLSAQRRLWSDWADAQTNLKTLWSDWADAQADLSLRCAHNHIVRFVMRRLIFYCHYFLPEQSFGYYLVFARIQTFAAICISQYFG